jgi:hypothetical protein
LQDTKPSSEFIRHQRITEEDKVKWNKYNLVWESHSKVLGS